MRLLALSKQLISQSSSYTLELETPQPDFRSAFGYVKENIRKSDLVITPYPILSRIYLGKTNYSIDYNPSGIQFGSITYANTTYDVYTNHTAILNLTMFEGIISKNTGFIIVDKFSLRRMDKGIANEIRNLTLVKNIDKDIYSGYQ